MLSDKIHNKMNNLLIIEYISAKWVGSDPSIRISAPDKDGYEFLCWVSMWSEGTVALIYTNAPDQQKNIPVFTDNETKMTNNSVGALVLYIKK